MALVRSLFSTVLEFQMSCQALIWVSGMYTRGSAVAVDLYLPCLKAHLRVAVGQYPLPARPVAQVLSLIHIPEPTRLLSIPYAVFCLKKKRALAASKPDTRYLSLLLISDPPTLTHISYHAICLRTATHTRHT